MTGLLNLKQDWQMHWRGMPAFDQRDLTPGFSVEVMLRSAADRDALAALLERNLTPDTRSVWHPRETIDRMMDKHWIGDPPLVPRYPVYVISKGRWESRLTVKALERMQVPHRVVIEPQEQEQYASVMDPSKLLILPFSNLGKGSIPARNWVWKHSMQQGAERHWILDDNISYFCRFQNNLKVPASCGNVFRAAEDFVDRYENVALAGFQYFMFVSRKTTMPPYVLNTRIYSCILIRNDLPISPHWRGRYNEDTDLSLRCLKDGWCTVLFNAFLALKQTTMTMKGGNTDELYKGDGRFDMAESLRLQHPDVVTVTRKWDRWQHCVDYSQFKKNKLRLKPGIDLDELPDADDYGMSLRMLEREDESCRSSK